MSQRSTRSVRRSTHGSVGHDIEVFASVGAVSPLGASIQDGTPKEAATTNTNHARRPLDDSWQSFTDAVDPHKRLKATCKNCGELVSYQRKSERVRNHLMKCKPYVERMMLIDKANRPHWFNKLKEKEGSQATKSLFSTTSNSQSSMRKFLIPALSKTESENVNKAMAMHYYMTGTSFSRIEESNLHKAFKICRPDVKLPSRKHLAERLLDSCHQDVKNKMDSYFKKIDNFCCVTSDGWSNIKNESIINYMIGGGSANSLFIESIATGEQCHSAQFIASDIERVIKSLEDKGVKVAGAVTDNTTTNRAAWASLKTIFPAKFFQGCVSHGLHLFVKDIFAQTKTKRGRLVADYPEDYPFEYLLKFSLACKDVVSFFSYHHQMKSKLTTMQLLEGKVALVQPAATRWGTLKACFESLLESETILHSLVSERDFLSGTAKQRESRLKTFNTITSDTFIQNLEKSIKILKPIDAAIVLFQNDKIPVSTVYHVLNIEMNQYYANMVGLTVAERNYLLKTLDSRAKFLYGDAIGIAYLLDPVYLGDGMNSGLKEEVEDKIFNYANVITRVPTALSGEEETVESFQQYTKWLLKAKQERTQHKFRFQMLKSNVKTRYEYWKLDGEFYPKIQSLAMVVFGMMTSSAASERNFSTIGFIHSKLRNSLGRDRVEKLVYIKSNAPVLAISNVDEDHDADVSIGEYNTNSTRENEETEEEDGSAGESTIDALLESDEETEDEVEDVDGTK